MDHCVQYVELYALGETVSPEHIVRQIGPPTWFMTFAAAEWSFPSHVCMEDILTHVNALDVFSAGGIIASHISHIMMQIIKGFTFQTHYNKPLNWKN